jgi:DNA (cytosine-5)-methyltransferase 1
MWLTVTMFEPVKVLSLFTGVGGLDLGLEESGCSIVGSVEFDPVARDAILKNRPSWRHLVPHDVCKFTSAEFESLELTVGSLDIIAGAPPCQPFSTAAQWSNNGRKGMNDNRANTVHAMLNFVEFFLPKVILMENVTGFVMGRDSALPEIEERLGCINRKAGTDYTLTWSIVDSVVYGVPQHRRRALIVISRDGTRFTFPPPTHADEPVTAWDAIGSIDPGPLTPTRGRWAELLPAIPEGENYQWLTARGGGVELFGYRTRYWSFLLKLAKDRPSWTIPASPGPSTGPFHWDNRPLAVPELLRLQSFPSDWSVAGSHRDQIRQIGNATPPLLGEVMGREILHQLLGRPTMKRDPSLNIPHSPYAPPPPRPTEELPPGYLAMAGPRAPHPGIGLGPASRKVGA